MARKGYALDGRALRRAREARRLTQAELAEAIGSARWTVNRLETGTRRASLVLIRALEKVLGVTAAQLGADLPEQG